MEQYTFFQPKNVLSVSQLTSYLREVLESDPVLQDLWVEGEISNLSLPASGHHYFTLKDSTAAIRCVMWRSAAARLNFTPREGMAIEAHGSMSVYEVSGQVQLYVDTLRPAGEGALYQEFQRLKAKLSAEGLFDPECKRPLPEIPRTIGIITSPTGAALQDMLNTLRRRFPLVTVVLASTTVQGSEAPAQIVTALERLNDEIHPDVILIGRGGGSIEDLWAFNDEAVVRAVAASTAPIVSGVGHETDFTLTDFAADLRAPTPTAAAELVVPDKMELLGIVTEVSRRHSTLLRDKLQSLGWEHGQQLSRLEHLSPAHKIDTYRQRLDETAFRLNHATRILLERKQFQLDNFQQSLKTLNPIAVLSRGYAIVTRKTDHQLISRSDQVNLDDPIHIQVSQGSMDAHITKINPGEEI